MPAIDFITRYPEALTGIFTLSLAATTGTLPSELDAVIRTQV